MRALILLASLAVASSFYSIKYYIGGEDAKISNLGLIFTKAPSALEVAHLVTRLCGKEIGSEIAIDESTLPMMEAANRKLPVLVDLHGGMLPAQMITEVISSNNFVDGSRGPHGAEVAEILYSKDIDVTMRIFDGSDGKTGELVKLLQDLPEGSPAIILHHETPAEYHFETHRRLTNAGNSSYVEPPSSADIGNFNIVLWTAVGLVAIVYASVTAISNMEIIPDSILYAKFASGRGKKSD